MRGEIHPHPDPLPRRRGFYRKLCEGPYFRKFLGKLLTILSIVVVSWFHKANIKLEVKCVRQRVVIAPIVLSPAHVAI